MPKLFRIGSYLIYFWSNENNEPIHVHVGIGTPHENATKIWLTKSGQCVLAHNKSRISTKDLSEIMEIISAQFFLIVREWKRFFNCQEVKFYC